MTVLPSSSVLARPGGSCQLRRMNLKTIMKGSTVVVGLNGALQKRLVLNEATLIPGNVHRAIDVQMGVGGKGQDVAVTLSCLQYSGDLCLAQFLGCGPEGDQVCQMLKDLLGEEAMRLTIRPSCSLRTCTSIVTQESTTELVEPSGIIHESEIVELLDRLEDVEAGYLCIMGSMPPGCPDDTYANVYRKVATTRTLFLIDTVSGLEPLLKAIAEGKKGPTILKVNASELCKMAGVTKTTGEVKGVAPEVLISAVQGFVDNFKPFARQALTAIAITDGAHPGHLAAMPLPSENEFRLFQLPIADIRADKNTILYPIGAGDAVAAGTLAAWHSLTSQEPCLHPDAGTALKGNESPSIRAVLAAFGFGLACGSASCLQEQNSVLKVQDAVHLYNREGRPAFLSSHKLSG